MKKTLKVLMATLLVAMLLTIATTVNAALADVDLTGSVTLSHLEDNSGVDEDGKLESSIANGFTGTLIVDKDAELDLNGIGVSNIEVQSGKTLTLTNSGTKTTIVKIINKGTLVVDSANITISDLENEGNATVKSPVTNTITNKSGELTVDAKVGTVDMKAGTLTLGDAAAITTLKTAVNLTLNKGTSVGTINTVNEDVVVTIPENSPLASKTFKVAGKATQFKTVDGTVIFAYKDKIELSMTLKDKEGALATDYSKGKEYAVVVKARIEGKLLEGTTTFEIGGSEEKMVDKLTGANQIDVINEGKMDGIKFVKDLGNNKVTLNVKFTIPAPTGLEVSQSFEIPADVNQPTTEPTAEPTNTPEPTTEPTTEPTNTPDDKDNLEKDETPKTGDHIIPATAVLAVVVVANVVYFARSKRS